ncbi:hypothetical protein OG874_23625 [Nocardia sp. NBC_00565]|uniref:hypothetical protein n=1 Tax=Nocardia sp. NBC_00565 TaxID=2975993 RepID=UPI002E81A644|nr:hypothetical protein [Nocardia sp. NBC_00565]WUC08349.1 hypothetical protein OG874_23625 [Nocardia sp. NBC_00565]
MRAAEPGSRRLPVDCLIPLPGPRRSSADPISRGLIPPGPFDTTGAEAANVGFEHWFGGADTFELLDTIAGRIGATLYLGRRIRMCPKDSPDAARIAEQHFFATAGNRIESIDLLCSGWNAEH